MFMQFVKRMLRFPKIHIVSSTDGNFIKFMSFLNETLSREYLIIGTHSGTFHADEVLACAMLALSGSYKEIWVVRTRDPEILSKCHIIVDVGGGVLVLTRGDGVEQHSGGVGTLLLHLLQVLAQLLVLVLAFADASHGSFVGIHLDAALVGFKLALQLLLGNFLLGVQFALFLLSLVIHSGKAVLNLAVARHQLHDFLFVHSA